MDAFTLVIISILKDFQPGRFLELTILLAGAWWKIKPHLTKMENEVKGLKEELGETNEHMRHSFEVGNSRFTNIESRLDKIEINFPV